MAQPLKNIQRVGIQRIAHLGLHLDAFSHCSCVSFGYLNHLEKTHTQQRVSVMSDKMNDVAKKKLNWSQFCAKYWDYEKVLSLLVLDRLSIRVKSKYKTFIYVYAHKLEKAREWKREPSKKMDMYMRPQKQHTMLSSAQDWNTMNNSGLHVLMRQKCLKRNQWMHGTWE